MQAANQTPGQRAVAADLELAGVRFDQRSKPFLWSEAASRLAAQVDQRARLLGQGFEQVDFVGVERRVRVCVPARPPLSTLRLTCTVKTG